MNHFILGEQLSILKTDIIRLGLIMSGKIEIRRLKAEDVDEFFEFFSKSILTQFPEYSKASREWLIESPRAFTKARILKNIKEGSLWMAALVGDQFTGFIYGEKPWGGVSDIYWLAVDDHFQHKGIGRALLMKFEEIIKDLGAHSIHLRSDQRNLEFYKKAGYETIGLETKAYLGADDYVLRKIIQEPKEENFLK